MTPLADPARRQARLLELLPRIYAAQPSGSAVGTLLAAMAQRLADFDADLKRVLHDRWVALACGVADGQVDDGESALDRLGALLQIARLPARIGHGGFARRVDGGLAVDFESTAQRDEALHLLDLLPADGNAAPQPRIAGLTVALRGPTGLDFGARGDAPDRGTASPLDLLQGLLVPERSEAYRQRLRITVAVTAQGLVTPRALLSLAIADLGAEPCTKFRRDRDATLARAVAPGVRKRCPACADPALPCPQTTLFDAWITEQPTQPAAWQAADARLQQVLTLRNDSLASDRPELTISVDRPVSFPALQSRASGEIMLYADDLQPGSTLRLLPQLSPAEAAATLSYDRPVAHQWLLRSPRGRAELVDDATGVVRDVSASVFYLWGNRFDDEASRLGGVNVDGLRCGVLEQTVRSPLLRPGDNDWMLLTFTAPAYRFDAPTSRLAGAPNEPGAHFALLDADIADTGASFAARLFELLKRTDEGDVDPATLPHFKLAARWLARPPFLFKLRIPKNDWLQAAELRGAVDLLRADIERARPVGVRARVDFPEPVHREHQPLEQWLEGVATRAGWTERAAPADAEPAWAVSLTLAERHPTGERGPTMGAVIDTTRFDWSSLQ